MWSSTDLENIAEIERLKSKIGLTIRVLNDIDKEIDHLGKEHNIDTSKISQSMDALYIFLSKK
jgi:hypothetical protein